VAHKREREGECVYMCVRISPNALANGH